MQKQRIIILIAGLVLALVSLFMVMAYIDQQVQVKDQQRKKILAKQLASQVVVLVAKEDIPKGTTIGQDMLETAIYPDQFVQPQAVTSLDRIFGMVTIAPIAKGEQITLGKLMSAKEATGGSLAMATPVGKRAVTISVDNIASVGGMVRPSDYVDVIATVPVPVQTKEGKQESQAAVVPLFQNVLVLAVGQETGALSPAADSGRYQKEEKKETSPYITLALDPQQANLMAFVQEQGRVRLTLRSPSDAKIESVQPASWDTLFQYMVPKETLEAKQKEEARQKELNIEESGQYIEIYRGMKKEKIPLSK